jgi:hypothetical protein
MTMVSIDSKANMGVMDSIKHALTCGICQDIVTLPVHPTCCDRAKSMTPGCLYCVREYYDLNKKPGTRVLTRKSWGGCGCDVHVQHGKGHQFYTHTTQLDMIRNSLGPSVCHHEECVAACETAAELRRHLCGKALPTDKHGNCLKAITKCEHCKTFGTREFILGQHYKDRHETVNCDICNSRIHSMYVAEHYNWHKDQWEWQKIRNDAFLVRAKKQLGISSFV